MCRPNVVHFCQSPSDDFAVSQGLHATTLPTSSIVCSALDFCVIFRVGSSWKPGASHPREFLDLPASLPKLESAYLGQLANRGRLRRSPSLLRPGVEGGKDCCGIGGSVPAVVSVELGFQGQVP